MKITPTIAVAACAFALSPDAEIQLLPAGEFRAVDGRPNDAPHWFTNAAIAAKLIADLTARANPCVIDYEHQTLLAADNGQPAPAAGWFKALRWVEGVGLFAQVEWTERAAAHIAAGEYKFISPVIAYDKATGAIKKLINAALTNNPAIDGMEEVSAALTQDYYTEEKLSMDIEELLECIRYLLNLPTLATPEEVAAELQKAVDLIKTGEGEAVAANSLGVVGLAQMRVVEIVSLKARLETTDAALSTATAELTSLKAEAADKQVADLVTAALSAHKIAPAQKDAMIELGKANLALLTSIIDNAVPVVASGESAKEEPKTAALAAEFDVPQGYQTDPAQVELLARAQAHAKTHHTDLETALTAVLKGA